MFFLSLQQKFKNMMFMKSLGNKLKELREIHRFTLRQVEEATGISNAYLSQLENDKIAKPSANVLYKLSNIYNVELDTLLAAAGIIEKKSSSNKLLNSIITCLRNLFIFQAHNSLNLCHSITIAMVSSLQ